jgi:uncharacterized lipoprotein YddW (UPF0748 family)
MIWLKRNYLYYLLMALGMFMFVVTIANAAERGRQVFLPVLGRSEREMVEVRGLWVTRFDWTNYASADPDKIDEIVDRSAAAGFNVLFFQVRGVADAYYTPGLEPWARRLSGTLGKDPGWDPLARLIQRAHQRGLQVHAYVNIYPVWTGCDVPLDDTEPRHLYHLLLEKHGTTNGKPNGLMWDSNGEIPCVGYQRVSPASTTFDTHIVAVTRDLVQRYDIDGLHLDHIRYDGEKSSCDPVSEERFGGSCFSTEDYKDWQRQQVNGTVQKMYEQILPLKSSLWLTAAVWPVYRDVWEWGVNSGYDTYYQDAKAWMAKGTIDGVAPMIYSGEPNCDLPYFWTLERWQILVQDYLNGSNDRLIIPGIGTSFCTNNDFGEIEARINKARSLGTAGHAIFSYKSVLDKGYFDDLANGPYKVTAVLPELPWR